MDGLLMDRKFTNYDKNGVATVTYQDFTWAQVRTYRNQLLTDTDWRAVKDRTMSQAWKDYRTALRDLPQDYDSANDAADNWPVMPDA